MMSILIFLLLSLLQFLIGWGILIWCKIKLLPWLAISFSMMLGIGICSLVPFLLQLLYLPINHITVFGSLVLCVLIANIKCIYGFKELKSTLQLCNQIKNKLYEWPFLLMIAFLIFLSAWRCYYYPPLARDITSGSEVIAEYAVKEKTMINSVFTVNLETTNNQFKPPYVTSLQIIYKLAGFPFGQLWLSVLVLSFIIFLYSVLKQKLHAIIVGILILLFIAIPELYAYTFMILFDYSNMIFLFLGIYFLSLFFKNQQNNYLGLSAFLFGLATYIRSETLVLICFLVPIIIINQIKYKQKSWLKSGFLAAVPVIVSGIFYFLSITIYINKYLPVKYDIKGLINNNLLNLEPLITRFKEMNTMLIFGDKGIVLYGYFFFIFGILLLLNLIIKPKLNPEARTWLYFVLVIYVGMPILGYLLPLLDLQNSTKRGLFKIFPLILLYLGNNDFLIKLSNRITSWENKLA